MGKSNKTKKTDKFYRTCVVALALFLAAVLIGVFLFKNRTTTNIPSESSASWFYSSFTDLFSGTGWIDRGETTLYQDSGVTAVTLPPLVSFAEIESKEELSRVKTLPFAAVPDDIRCIGTRCLMEKDSKLFLRDSASTSFERVPLPEQLSGKQVENISIGSVDGLWLVGAVTRSKGKYTGEIFYFNGSNYFEIFKQGESPLVSPRNGRLGFGGNYDDWLAIYGASPAVVVRVKNCRIETATMNACAVYRIPEFLGSRVMGSGFYPAVLKIGSGKNASWYVFSLTDKFPKFIKLFQNETDEIQGALDLSSVVIPPDASSASLLPETSADPASLILMRLITADGEVKYRRIIDRGFDKSKPYQIVSSNINNYDAEIRIAKISELDLATEGARVKFFLSNDAKKWLPASLGKEIVFPDKLGQYLLWKAEFIPDDNPSTSPFMSQLRIDYQGKIR